MKMYATLASIVLMITAVAASQHMMLHDCSKRHLHSGTSTVDNLELGSPSAAAGLTAALAGLVPPQPLDQKAAQQVSAVVKSKVFDRAPKALVMLNLAGVAPDDGTLDSLAAALPSGTAVHTKITSQQQGGSGAEQLLMAQAGVATANPDVAFHALDESALEGCNRDCLTAHLKDVLKRMGGSLQQTANADSPQPWIAASSLKLPGGASLALDSGAGQLLGAELAALHGATAEKLQARLSKPSGSQTDQVQGDEDNVSVYHSTLVGIQALRDEAAALLEGDQRHAAAAAAGEALAGVVKHIAGEMQKAFGDEVVYLVTLLGDVAGGKEGAEGAATESLQDWKQERRRALMEGAITPGSSSLSQNGTAADGKAFATKATGYGVALLLIYATAAILYAMVNMPFKQDTLLYGRQKAE